MNEQPSGAVVSEVAELSILYFDVETSWIVAKVFNMKPDYIRHNQIMHDWFMHVWAAQWAGTTKILSDRQTSAEALAKDDARIAGSLAELVRQADIVIAHNGDRFDIPRLRNRLVVHNLETLGPVDTIDTLKVARKLGFTHNNLDALAQTLGVGTKMDNPPGLWDQAYEGSDVALQSMTRYCKHDVFLLAGVFEKLRPHAVGLRRLVEGEGVFCPSCGSVDYIKRGKYRTAAGKAQRFQCQNCARYFRDKNTDAAKTQMRPL